MKKLLISCVLVASTALAIVGTRAYYSTTLTSSGNKITSANFIVKSDGTLDGNEKFNVEKFAPGKSAVYKFTIDKSGTEVPVVYNINFNKTGDLFAGDTPVKLSLVKYTSDTTYEPVNESSIDNLYILYPTSNIEDYGLKVDWPFGNSSEKEADIYAGKGGDIMINVKASQLMAAPDAVPDPIIEKNTTANVSIRDPYNNTNQDGRYTKNEQISFDKTSRIIKLNDDGYLGDAAFQIDEQLAYDGTVPCKLIYATKDVGYVNGENQFVHYAGSDGWTVYKGDKLLIFKKSFDDNKLDFVSIRAECSSSISDWK